MAFSAVVALNFMKCPEMTTIFQNESLFQFAEFEANFRTDLQGICTLCKQY